MYVFVNEQPGFDKIAMKAALRILNLEDNPNDAELNQAMISARWPDCEMIRVATREDFIAALVQEKYDLILSDYTIPGFNGREALTIARERCPETPFLFVSGTIGEDGAIEALKNGATDYVLKHRLMRLIPAVDRALREMAERAEREHAERVMRESEHKYREVFESLGEAAFLADEETGRIIDTNRCAEKMTGYDRSQILGHKLSEFLKVADMVMGDNTVPYECRLSRAEGEAQAVKVHSSRLTLYGRPLVLWLCQNPDRL
jgi:PAS domain S-box-containing protein